MPALFTNLFSRFRRAPRAHNEMPIREELYSAERLEQSAAALAAEHRVLPGERRGKKLFPRLEENGRLLISAYRSLADAIREERAISPAAEWLVDNFHIVEEQLREIREDLPRKFYYELPKLAEGELAGYPRIYALALALIAHTDSRLETETLRRFVIAYQQVAPLTIGELWAVAIVLRVALVENLRRLAMRVIAARAARDEADALADRLLTQAARQQENVTALLDGRLGKREDIDRAFVVQLALRLRDQDPAVTPALDWLERQLRRRGQSSEQIIHLEHQRQAAAQVTVGNIITSMRLLSTLDWRDFFESISRVDTTLADDPAGVYRQMDFATRDRYRHVIERIAKRTDADEIEVAQAAVRLAATAQQFAPQDERRAHVGFYLIDDGLLQLETKFNYRPRLRERLTRAALRHPTLVYLGTFSLLTVFLTALLVLFAYRAGAGLGIMVVFALLSLIPASDLALAILNWDITHLFKPRPLPKLDAARGIPAEATTFVVVPTLLTSEAGVRELLEKLEVHFLANQDEQLYFALLGDYADALAEELPEDAGLLEAALDGIEKLNARYSDGESGVRFHLFQRRRLWNEGEGRWMGWERKRGKLEEFNRMLGGARDTGFVVATADPALLSQVRYVITLDTDTQLPRDAARRLVGVALHPLNRPQYSAEAGRVVRGYGVFQPRTGVSLESSSRSRYARIFSGSVGIDPYSTAASDVYQDLFGEGIFTGKGIYNVDAFKRSLAGRVPENSILSHDLFEGLHARCALVTDIELLEDFPAHYEADAKRQHRWVRGDWQIAPWLFSRVPGDDGRQLRNSLPLIARWKIFDNLRRSLLAPGILVWLVAVWTFMPGSPLWWTLFAIITLAFPVYAHLTTNMLTHPRGVRWTSHFREIWSEASANTAQVLFAITGIAHQAYLKTDAIARSLYRKLISHRRLLEWIAAAQAEQGSAHSLAAMLRFMWPAVLIALVVGLLVVFTRPEALVVAAPFLLAWALSPLVMHWASRRLVVERQQLDDMQQQEARLVARRTWRFFEEFVSAEDNWLPPDNFQEDPLPVVAHRTSPTNTGLLLLSTVAAHDFGYVGTIELVERLELTFATIDKLPKFRGHLFNWYDTRTLEPLMPQYISTVDSGNLAGHLLALKGACVEMPDVPLFGAHTLAGLADTSAMLSHEVEQVGGARQRSEVVTAKNLRQEVAACAEIVGCELPETLSGWATLFDSFHRHALIVDDMLYALAQEQGAADLADARFWANALLRQVAECRRDLRTLTRPISLLDIHQRTIDDLSSTEAAASWSEIARTLDRVSSLSQMSETYDTVLTQLAALAGEGGPELGAAERRTVALDDLAKLSTAVEDAALAVNALLPRFSRLARRCEELFEAIDFTFLLDHERKLFYIGYNMTLGRPDESYYDLLASEARQASFVAIAKGDAPQEHWFRLGRQLTSVNGDRALISWTATMFEYLMPLLVMRSYDETLLNQTGGTIVARQIEYGAERGVPWGVSESAYNARDLHLNYQYGPFGVPGLGLKRGLSEDLVVAPYATMLAAMVEPRHALENLRRLTREGALARYGFYEAIDYTRERLPQNQKRVLVRAFMTHHQGMSLVALDNLLNANIMQRRFHSEPLVQATELILQERIPRDAPLTRPRAEEVLLGRIVRTPVGPIIRTFDTADLPTPRTQILSNGAYSAMITTSGAGYSRCADLAVTRWREDATRDHFGSFYYLRDVRSGTIWSAGYQPTLRRPRSYEVTFSEYKVEIVRSDAGIVTHTEIIVSAEDNVEVRRISLTNQSARVRDIEVTSYAEVVLTPQAADAAHPAFSNLFVETEFIHADNALLARRRPRASTDEPVWGVHVVTTEGETVGTVQYETDRSRFIGRGHTPASPVAVTEERPLSNTTGTVLDPIFSLRQRVRLQPGETARVIFATALARTREEALRLADTYHDHAIFEREEQLAWTRSQVQTRHLNVTVEEAHLFQRLAGRLLYSDPSLRPRPHVLAMNTKAQAALWPYGIGGDLPIVLVRISRAEHLDTARQALRGHEYLRLKGLQFDLVILIDHPMGYAQELQNELQALVRTSGSQFLQDKTGGVFLRRADLMPDADRILLHAVARAVFVTERGTLEEQLVRRPVEEELPPDFIPRALARAYPAPALPMPELNFFNGLGGFAHGGREYVTVLGEGQWTPAPWTNVIANEHDFGFLVTEGGGGFTWSVNSRENRLTPWSNDAVSDPPGEIIYLRDEESGNVWTPTPLPIRETEPYVIRHGQGYTVFEHTSHGIAQELLMFVPVDTPVKISVLRLSNRTDRRRRISVTSYNELVLGFGRGTSAPYIITELDEQSGAILARNPYNNEFADRVAFVATSAQKFTITCDRKEFLGRNGSPASPSALRRAYLAGRAGAGLDPCAAIQTIIDIAPGETCEVVFLLGEGESVEEARAVVARFDQPQVFEQSFERVLARWDDILETVQVRTPDTSMDTILNRWLLYQTLACRMWARSAFYQSGGAYGFRDQLQDVMALVYSRPQIAREQITRAAAHQFKEGDVQHWWHPPTGRGVRTRFSDDLLWLPYVTSFYLHKTGDAAILDEVVPFIEAPPLEPGQDESYMQPTISQESASIYEHCLRTLDRSLEVGAHGLPLMGSGDWNDGMNRVGHEGKGESVWVGWFLYNTLEWFAPICEARGDLQRAKKYRAHMAQLKKALEENAWDGDWYRRAYFDDGTPLGSAQNDECRIDSIVQSWGVISGAADPHRAARAMASVEEYLIRRGDGLIILFTPPFDKSALDPGYIKSYVPGVRENGGQYTHGALWMVIAYAVLGDGDRAGELFALLNPINHALSRAGLHKYKVEPYVAAADVYAVWPHTGRGGWTWYTGSAGWMYRTGLEFILGFQLRDETLRVEPCIPRSWREYEINYRHRSARYHIKVENPHGLNRGVALIELDGERQATIDIPLRDDGANHTVRVVLGEPTLAEQGKAREQTTQEQA
ncbi:MAG: hypothetical protein M3407_09610 [Acidobacteriota bacterium]|nr:hypothetical protein [Acidobacteriota bacterium]